MPIEANKLELELWIALIINPKTKFEYIVVLLCIFNPSSILLIERMNLDIFIFLISIFITFNRFYFFNWFIIYFATFIKIYPAILGINIFIENVFLTKSNNANAEKAE